MKNQLQHLKQNNFINGCSAVVVRKATGILFFVLILFVQKSFAQLSLTNAVNTATIDFSSSMQTAVGTNPGTAFTGAGFSPDPTSAGRLNSNAWAATGWSDGSLAFGGTQASNDFGRGSTSSTVTTGGFYAYTGLPGSASNPAFMIQPGGSDWAPGTLTLRIKNNGTTNITQLAVSYNIYVRNDQLRSNSFNFSYSTDDVTYTPVSGLDYTSTAASDLSGWVIVGSAPSRSTTISSLSIAPNSLIYIRWSGADAGGSGSRDEFGLDDISLNATFGASPGTFTPGALAAFGNVCVNTIAGPNSFSLSGSGLDGSAVTVGPLAGFTFDNGSGYGTTASITGYGTSFSTTINVKFNPVAPQAYGGTGVNGIPISGGNGAPVHVNASGTGIAMPSITAATASPNPACSGSNVVIASVPSAVSNSGAVGTSTGNSAAGNTPYRSAITTEARVQYIFTAAELAGIGMAANSNINSLAFNVNTPGSGTMTNYTISIATTAATSFASTSYLTGTFITVYGPQSYTAAPGVNTHTFSAPFTWNGTSGIVINICYNSTGGTSSVVSVNSPGGNLTDSRSGTNSCATSTGTLDAGRPIATFGYTSNPNPNIYDWSWSSGATTNSATVTPASSQSYTVTATTPGSACSATSVVSVTVNQPSIAPTGISGTTPLCIGDATTLTATGGTLGTGANYQWGTGGTPGVNPLSGETASTLNVSPTGSITYWVRIENTAAPCTGTTSGVTQAVTVNTLSTAPVSVTSDDPDNEICSGSSVLLTANGGVMGSSPGTSYKWYEGGCGAGTALSSVSTLAVTPSAGSHTYYARIEDACGNTACASLTILVTGASPGIVTGGFTAPSAACSGTVSLVTVTPVGGPDIHYSWNTGTNSSSVLFSANIGGPFSAGPLSTPTNQVYAQFGFIAAGQSGYYVCVQGVNACGSTANRCIWIRGTVNGPGPITPANGVVACPNDVKSYSCGASGGASLYSWTLSGSSTPITSGQGTTNVQVTFPPAFTSGQLCVTAALACGGSSTSPARCMTINKNPANPNVPTGAATVCPGATGVSYSIAAVPGATGYNWTVPANATIASGTNSPSITVNFPTPYNGSSSVCVTTTSACGASAVKCKSVASGIPAQPAGISGPLTNVCGSTVQYSVVNPSASSYAWTNPAGTTISGSATGSTILLNVSPNFTSGTLTVVANSVACTPATSAPRTSGTIWGRPDNPGAITANPTIWCSGGGVNFSITPASPLPTYTWTVSNGTIDAGQGSNNIDVTWGASTAGTVSVRAGNGCGLSAGTRSQSFSSGCREEGINALSATDFSVYPNPAHDKVTVSIYVKESTQFNIKLCDLSGRVILSEDRQAEEGLNAYNMDLKGFAKGIYMLEVLSANDRWKTKVAIE